jgi:hypothetical protein
MLRGRREGWLLFALKDGGTVMDDNFFSRIKGSNELNVLGETIYGEFPDKLFFGSRVTSMSGKDEVIYYFLTSLPRSMTSKEIVLITMIFLKIINYSRFSNSSK